MAGNNIGGPKILSPKPDNNGVASLVFHLNANQVQTQTIQITDSGEPGIDWSSLISYSAGAQAWLTLNPGNGKFVNHKNINVDVKVNTAGLQPGTQYTATVIFDWDNQANPPADPTSGTLVVKLFT